MSFSARTSSSASTSVLFRIGLGRDPHVPPPTGGLAQEAGTGPAPGGAGGGGAFGAAATVVGGVGVDEWLPPHEKEAIARKKSATISMRGTRLGMRASPRITPQDNARSACGGKAFRARA